MDERIKRQTTEGVKGQCLNYMYIPLPRQEIVNEIGQINQTKMYFVNQDFFSNLHYFESFHIFIRKEVFHHCQTMRDNQM